MRKIPHLSYIVLALLAIGLIIVVYRGISTRRHTANVEFSKSHASDYGYGYGIPRGQLSYSNVRWDPKSQTWFLQINYVLKNVEYGSLKKGQNTIIVNNISGSGSVSQQLPPRSRTVYSVYPLPNGQGRQLDEITVVLPSGYGYGY